MAMRKGNEEDLQEVLRYLKDRYGLSGAELVLAREIAEGKLDGTSDAVQRIEQELHFQFGTGAQNESRNLRLILLRLSEKGVWYRRPKSGD